jgi:WD40 repeat protein
MAVSAPVARDGGAKAKVFISYSRKDMVFVDKLDAALRARGFEPMIDREQIYAFEDWWKRIEGLVTKADTVVFVLSPDAVTSDICAKEVAFAGSLNKRFAPVVCRPVEDSKIPAELRRLNFVFCDDESVFNARMEQLADALATDIHWVRKHTEYGELAQRWSAAGQPGPRGLLLRSPALEEAEHWIASRPANAPVPTETTQAFIAESRRAATQRRSVLSASLGAGLIAALGLCVVTLNSYRDADRDFSLALLATADRLLNEEKPTHSLVVAEALQHVGGLRRFLDSVGLLTTSTEDRVRIATIVQLTAPAISAPLKSVHAISPATAIAYESGQVAVGYNSGVVTVLDEQMRARLRLTGHTGRVLSVKFAPGGKRLVSATSRQVIVWDLEKSTGRMLCDSTTEVLDVAFDPVSNRIAWTQRDGTIVIFDIDGGRPKIIAEHLSRALAIEFSRDGKFLASTGDDGAVSIRETATWKIHRKFATGRLDLVGMSLSPDATRVATASLSGSVDIWPLDVEQPAQNGVRLIMPVDKRWKIRYSRDGRWLALTSWQGTVTVWTASTLSYRGTIDANDTRINDVAFADEKALIISVSEGGFIRTWSLDSLRPMFITVSNDPRETVYGKYSWDGKKFVVGGKSGIATLFDVLADGSLNRKCEVRHQNWVFEVAFSHDSKIVYSVGPKEGAETNRDPIKIWSSDNCAPMEGHAAIPAGLIVHVASSPVDSHLAWSSRDGEIWLGRMEPEAAPVRLPRMHSIGVGELSFSPNGKYLLSSGLDGRVIVWDVASRSVYRELRGHASGAYIYTARFSSNNATIATSGTEPKIAIWNLNEMPGREHITDLPLLGGANRLAFSPDGNQLAVGSGNRTISIWSVADWRKIFQLNTLVGIRSVYDFHPQRGDLAFDGENGAIRIVPKAELGGPSNTPPKATMVGMNVFFDMGQGASPDAGKIAEIQANSGPCFAVR